MYIISRVDAFPGCDNLGVERDHTTVAVVLTKRKAIKVTQKLNEEFGEDCLEGEYSYYVQGYSVSYEYEKIKLIFRLKSLGTNRRRMSEVNF